MHPGKPKKALQVPIQAVAEYTQHADILQKVVKLLDLLRDKPQEKQAIKKELQRILSKTTEDVPLAKFLLRQLKPAQLEKWLDVFQEDYDNNEKEINVLFRKIFSLIISTNDTIKIQIIIKKAQFHHLLYCAYLVERAMRNPHLELETFKGFESARDTLLSAIKKQVKTTMLADIFRGVSHIMDSADDISTLQHINQSPVFSQLIDSIKTLHGLTEAEIYETCLITAAVNGDLETTKKLVLGFNLDPNTPHLCLDQQNNIIKESVPVLVFAIVAKMENSQDLVNFLVDHKADVNIVCSNLDEGKSEQPSTADHESKAQFSFLQRQEREEYLVFKTPYGYTPLMLAIECEAHQTIPKLLEKTIDVNAATLDGNTALFFAAHTGALQVVKQLLAKSADPFLTNVVGESAIDFGKNEDIKNYIRKHILKVLFANKSNQSSTLRSAINDLCDQFHLHIGYERGEVLLNIKSFLEKVIKSKLKKNIALVSTLQRLPEKIKISDELIVHAFADINKTFLDAPDKITWSDIAISILRCSDEYQKLQENKEENAKPSVPIVSIENKIDKSPVMTSVDTQACYSKIVQATTSRDKQKERESKAQEALPLSLQSLSKSSDKLGKQFIQEELYFLKRMRDAKPISIAQMIKITNSILYVFGILMRKIIKLHDDFTITTVDTFLPRGIAQHLSNVAFHSHRSPLFFPGGNRKATLQYYNSVRTMVTEIYDHIGLNVRHENDAAKFATVMQSPLFHKSWSHNIPAVEDIDCIAQISLMRREMRLYNLAPQDTPLFSKEEEDEEILRFARRFTLCAHAAPYLKLHIIVKLQNVDRETHDKLVVLLPQLIDSGEIDLDIQKNINTTFVQLVDYIKKSGGVLRHPSLELTKGTIESFTKFALMPAQQPFVGTVTAPKQDRQTQYSNSIS